MLVALRDLSLAARLAGREMRAGLKGFRIFIACLALGVAAIAGVGTLSSAVVAGLRADSRALLGGDVEIRTNLQELPAEQRAYVRANAARVSEVVEMRAMARAGDSRALVELKAVDRLYPLVGQIALAPAVPIDQALAATDGAYGAVADANLLERLGLAVGDRLQIGEVAFVVSAAVLREPDRVASVVNFGPRVMIAAEALSATGLVQPGSQIRFNTRLLTPAAIRPADWIAAAQLAFPKAGWRLSTTDDAAPGVKRFIDRMTLFLTFVGLTALLVGGIGVANAVKSYLDGKTATIATFKCLGAPAGLVFRTYLIQVLGLALIGIGIGLVAGVVLPLLGLWLVGDRLPVRPVLGVHGAPLALGVAFGLLTALAFALWPLARARGIPAARLFRDSRADRARPPIAYLLTLAASIAALAALTVLTASERYFAYWFVGGAAVTLLVLRAAAAGLAALAARTGGIPFAEARLAVANLHRPGNATASVVVSLGLGLSVLVAIALIEGNMSRQIAERLPEEAPAFFFIDIQPDQVAAFDAAVAGVTGTSGLRRVPSLRGRIVAIAGTPVERVDIDPGAAWAVRGDRALTYFAERPSDARVVAGTWWPTDYHGPPLISLDAGLARGFGVKVGDTLTLNVLGREIEARIANLREIDWRSLRFDFAIIFAPGALEGAPYTHIAAVQAPPAVESTLEKAVVDRLPNVSAIRVREALEAAAQILDGIGNAVRSTASISLVAGALVLAGVIAAGRRRRVYDAVVLKVLGATRRRVLGAFVIEYGLLGLATGVIAAGVGTLTAWAVVRFLMAMDWAFLPATVVVTVAVCVVLTVAAGFAGTWRALGLKAAPLLRNR